MLSKLKDYLDKYHISYKEFFHPPVFTVAESSKIKCNIPGMHTKSLFLKDENKNYYLVCMNAKKRLNTKLLRNKLKIKELNFASPEELKSELDLNPGSVSLFGMINSSDVFLIIDKEIWDAKSSCFHPNINTSTLEISHDSLEKFLSSLKSKKQIINLDE